MRAPWVSGFVIGFMAGCGVAPAPAPGAPADPDTVQMRGVTLEVFERDERTLVVVTATATYYRETNQLRASGPVRLTGSTSGQVDRSPR